MENTDWFTIT